MECETADEGWGGRGLGSKSGVGWFDFFFNICCAAFWRFDLSILLAFGFWPVDGGDETMRVRKKAKGVR